MTISNTDNLIDIRDVIARIEELEEVYARKGPCTLTDDEHDELRALRDLSYRCVGRVVDWHPGRTLIRDSYFRDYAEELAEDCGMINSAATWPNNCIDWDQAARELQMDYTAVDFDGVTYWIR